MAKEPVRVLVTGAAAPSPTDAPPPPTWSRSGAPAMPASPSSTKNYRRKMNQIWEEFGPKINELLQLCQTGVVASILAACQRLETYRFEYVRGIDMENQA